MLVTWRLLNPLFFTQTLIWRPGEPISVERFQQQDELTAEWQASPLSYVIVNFIQDYRCRLAHEEAPRQFAVLDEFADEGMTDYVVKLVGFGQAQEATAVGAGALLSVCSDRPGGFLDEEIEALDRLKFMLAIAIRASFQAEIVETLARTYLGRTAGRKVLSGQITRGGGETVEAVIWYCDLRNSTALCERMGMDRYIPFLNDYFTASAGEVQAAGGEILDFIGDAVLAVFPFDEDGVARALEGTARAMGALRRFQRENCGILAECDALANLAGIAIDTGRVVYGNIGIADRLTFSVIGPTVNRVARIETLTKTLREPVLVSRTIADAAPGRWVSRGTYTLDGVAEATELFALARGEDELAPLAPAAAMPLRGA
jgi:adenylate cyclase